MVTRSSATIYSVLISPNKPLCSRLSDLLVGDLRRHEHLLSPILTEIGASEKWQRREQPQLVADASLCRMTRISIELTDPRIGVPYVQRAQAIQHRDCRVAATTTNCHFCSGLAHVQ